MINMTGGWLPPQGERLGSSTVDPDGAVSPVRHLRETSHGRTPGQPPYPTGAGEATAVRFAWPTGGVERARPYDHQRRGWSLLKGTDLSVVHSVII